MPLTEGFFALHPLYPWWIRVAYGLIIAGLVSAAVLSIRHRVRSWRRVVVSSVLHFIAAEATIGFGFFLEPTVWMIFNYGPLKIGEIANFVLAENFRTWRFLIEAGPAAFACAIAAITGGPRRDRMIRSALATIVMLTMTDTVRLVFIEGAETSSAWFFAMLSNILGGAAAGVIVGFVSKLISASLMEVEAPSPALSSSRARRIMLSGAAGGILALTAAYLLFFYHLPVYTTARLTDWRYLKFQFHGTEGTGAKPVSIRTSAFQIGSFDKTITIEVSNTSNDSTSPGRPVQVSVFELGRRPGKGLARARPAPGRPPYYEGLMPKGDIRVTGRRFVAAIIMGEASPGGPPRTAIFVPRFEELVLARVKDHVHSALRGETAALAPEGGGAIRDDTDGWLVARTVDDGRVVLDRVQRFSIHLWGLAEGAGRGAPVEEIALGDHVLRIPSQGDGSASPGTAVGIVVESGEALWAAMPLGDLWSCRECEVDFGGRDRLYLKQVRNVHIGDARGRLTSPSESRDLSEDDRIVLGGGPFVIETRPNGGLMLTGRGAPIMINDGVMSKTAWSSVPNEIKAVLIGAVATGIWGIAARVQRRRR
jgi:hypothetical protein